MWSHGVQYLLLLLGHFSRVPLSATLWTITHQDRLSMEFSRQEYWSSELPCPPPGDLPTQGSNLGLCIAGRFFTTEPPGKPKNTAVGSHSLLQWIFPTEESNWDLLHCRRILYQLNYQGRILICYHLFQNHSIPDTRVLLFLEYFQAYFI